MGSEWRTGLENLPLQPLGRALEWNQRRGISNCLIFYEGDNLLTEQSVERGFRKLFETVGFGEGEFEKAEDLLDQLRPESPLKHRLGCELDELRELVAAGR